MKGAAMKTTRSYRFRTSLVFLMTFALSGNVLAAESILKPVNKTESWRFEQHEEGKGKIAVDGDAIVFEVTNVDGTEWHVQAFQTPLDLKEGKEYTVTFKAKSSEEREVGVQAGIDGDDYHMIGLDEKAELTKEWKDYKYTFTASDVKEKMNRVGFVLGAATGKVWVKELALKQN
jgi:Carbohydrate binding domain